MTRGVTIVILFILGIVYNNNNNNDNNNNNNIKVILMTYTWRNTHLTFDDDFSLKSESATSSTLKEIFK